MSSSNLRALSWDVAPSLAAEEAERNGFVIDGTFLPPAELQGALFICRIDSGTWHACPSQAECCQAGQRTPAQAGPLRAIFEKRMSVVVGTSGSTLTAVRHLNAATVIANGQFEGAGSHVQIAVDTNFTDASGGASISSVSTNVVLLGGP